MLLTQNLITFLKAIEVLKPDGVCKTMLSFDVIIDDSLRFEGDNSSLIWKHPCEDYEGVVKIVVHEQQEAIVLVDGKLSNLFGPGQYIIGTDRTSLDDRSSDTTKLFPIHCKVYFVNKAEQMNIAWGTNSKINYIEPIYEFPVSIGASGTFSLSITDSKKLFALLLGADKELKTEQVAVLFRSLLVTKVKSYLANTIKTSKINIFEIDEKLEYMSHDIKNILVKDFQEYGLKLNQFFITTIARPEGEPFYEKFKELYYRQFADVKEAELQQKVKVIEEETKSKQLIIESQALAQKRKIEGYTYQQEREYDSMAGDKENKPHANLSQTQLLFCDQCGARLQEGAKFCSICGVQQMYGFCKNCGFQFHRETHYCPKCGSKTQ